MSSEKFDERYEKLNAEQKRAVDETEGPVMVVAGPGTGKTTILTLRIANILLKTDTPPSGILALTFTEAGAKNMQKKLRELIGSRADEVRVHTFHGFSASVIAEFDDHFPSLFRATQITDVEAEVFVRQILKEKKFAKLRPLGEPDFYVGKILGGISDCKKEAWTPEIVAEFATAEIERIQNDPTALSTRGATKGELKADSLKRIERCERTISFAEIYKTYEEKKKSERKIDFDDLIFELVVALKNDELLLRLLQEKFLYILVDEHQDTNDSQNLIVSQLANFFDTPNIFVVGDEKQAIYRFQGASVQNFLRFQNIWKNMQVIQLTDNYRSHQTILDATFSMIEKNYDDGQYENLRVRLNSKSPEKSKPIDWIVGGNPVAVDNYLVKELQKISKTDETTAVIVRWNRDVEYVLDICQKNNIPATAERGADIFSHPLGALYFGLLQYLIDPTFVEGLAETLAVSLWNLDFQKSVEVLKNLRAGNLENVLKEIPALAELQNEITRAGVLDFLILVAEVSGLTKKFEESPLSAEVWRAIISLSRELAEQRNVSDPRVLITALLSYKKSAESKSIKIGAGSMNAPVTIMTAHSSKGLEYDNVFLPFATEESWMRRARSSSFVFPREKDESDNVRDARRLFYVAITRAKKHVCILTSAENSAGKPLLPLRFIDELQKESVAQKNIPAEEEKIEVGKITELKSERKNERKEQRENEMVEYAKRSLLENGLSVTALNHFLNCPSEFFYKSVLKVPEAPSVMSEKGIAMHKALAIVWKEKNKTAETIQKIMEKTFREYFRVSLLPAFEKSAILDELLASAPKVATALKDYFNSVGKISVEKWVEKNFHSSAEKIDFELHGQLDVIIDSDKKIQVFDYKTREAMSENAIRGETQDADGNYFRQLVFYKMLLQKNPKLAGNIGNTNNIFEKQIEPSLIFVKPDAKGRCQTITLPISDTDIATVENEITTLAQSIFSGTFLSATCSDPSCKWCKMKGEFLK